MEQLQAVGAQLGIDGTVIPMFGLIVVFYFVIRTLYLKPFQKVLMDRKHKTEGVKAEAKELTAQAEAKMAQYREAMKSAHDQARKAFATKEEEARKEETKLVGDATAKARAIIQAANSDIDSQKKTVLEQINNDIPALAAEVAAKALGRRV